MCAIAGQLALRADPSVVRAMTRAQSHRGPDGEGFYARGPIALGHRRLSLVDPEGGAQPMMTGTETPHRHVLVANAEIYNYPALRTTLIARGHRFRTQSDCEVILHAYAEFGARCVEHLDGMFAFAIWDETRHELFLARDPFGIKPLYYTQTATGFYFSSELKGLRQIPDLDTALNPVAIDQFFAQLALSEPNTIFANVHKLRPGHTLTVSGTGVVPKARLRRYWRLDLRPRPAQSDSEWVSDLRREIARSVEQSLQADSEVGLFLSGGIDSSTLAAFATRQAPRPRTFTIAFNEERFNEAPWARAVAKAIGARHHEVLLTSDRAADIQLEIARAMDEPFADSSSIPTFEISRHARRHVKAVLSGEGGDELFAGYRWHDRKPVSRAQLICPDARAIFAPDLRSRLLRRGSGSSRAPSRLGATLLRFAESRHLSALNRKLHADIHVYLPSDLLFKMDRMSMLHSLEVRVPFLNRSFVEFASRAPDRLKLSGELRKHGLKLALRRELRGRLPAGLIERPKKGFGIPMDEWLRRPGRFRQLVLDTVLSRQTRERGLYDFALIRALVTAHGDSARPAEMQAAHGYRIWTVFVFEQWLRTAGTGVRGF